MDGAAFRAMDFMQLNTRTKTNPASAGIAVTRHADAPDRTRTRRRRPNLSRSELRRIIAEMIG